MEKKWFVVVLLAIIGVTAYTGFTLDYSLLTPPQAQTAKLSILGVLIAGLFQAALELWTLFNPPDRDHISPSLNEFWKRSRKFRVFLSSFTALVVVLFLHFTGVGL